MTDPSRTQAFHRHQSRWIGFGAGAIMPPRENLCALMIALASAITDISVTIAILKAQRRLDGNTKN